MNFEIASGILISRRLLSRFKGAVFGLMLHHAVNDAYQTAHNTNKSLRRRFPLADFPEKVFPEDGLIRFPGSRLYRNHSYRHKVEHAV